MSDTTVNYTAESDKYCKQFFDMVINCSSDDWKEVKKYKEDGITISSRPSPCISDKIFKAECVLPVSPSHALALCAPNLPYRTQWDPVLESLRVVRTIEPNLHMVYHVTKPVLKGVIAARDTLDLVRIGRAPDKHTPPNMRNGTFYVIAGSVKHDDFPPFDKIKRNWQYASGYLFEPVDDDENKCHWSMVFHTDLDMNQMAAMVCTMAKPTLMHSKMDALIKASRVLQVDRAHIDAPINE